jgi:hypothetical protein
LNSYCSDRSHLAGQWPSSKIPWPPQPYLCYHHTPKEVLLTWPRTLWLDDSVCITENRNQRLSGAIVEMRCCSQATKTCSPLCLFCFSLFSLPIRAVTSGHSPQTWTQNLKKT